MHTTSTIPVFLSANAMALLEKAMESGAYESGSDVIADALSVLILEQAADKEQTNRLRQLAEEAISDDQPSISMDAVMDRLEAKYKAMIPNSIPHPR